MIARMNPDVENLPHAVATVRPVTRTECKISCPKSSILLYDLITGCTCG